jgi:drug/metabolite transporter (DMT)-like permease
VFNGVLFALGACFIWGLIFVVPQFMIGFSPIEVALGRYSLYGVISFTIFLRALARGACRHSQAIWSKALYFSLISTIVYYTFVVLSLRYSSPAMCALILGTSPIMIAFYGNWREREVSFKSLLLPSILIIAGLLIINLPHLQASEVPSFYILGLVFSFLAAIAWSTYVLINSKFIKRHPEVCPSEWSTLLGVSTLFWVALCTAILAIFFKEQLHFEKYFILNEELIRFLGGSAILGLLCSWVGAFLWNKASISLPISLAGQLTIFETIFGVLFVYIVSQTIPCFRESIGIAVLLTAIIYGIKKFSTSSA